MSTGGQPQIRDVVLLHAGIADRRMWSEQSAALERAGYRALAPDLPGFGDEPLSADSPAAWDFVLGFMDRVGSDRAAVVGCSFGGAVALRVAVLAPDRVRALVLISAPAPGFAPSAQLIDAWSAEEAAIDDGDLDRAVESVLDTWLLPDAPTALRELVAAMQMRAYELQTAVEEHEHNDPLKRQPELLESIATPTLVAVGDHDLTDFQTSAQTLTASIPGACHRVIEGAGHLAPLETPASFQTLLGGFLAEVG